ncbi:unnamed protein product [Acanthoscelides obtectus]|nr:unnamed protein product [Acanthoscelides obtectus]CAK1649862.1 hypothetical protein AOBTE_LOCUS16466 [Acanthoscelides obtectus]
MFSKQSCSLNDAKKNKEKNGYLTAKVTRQIDNTFCHGGILVKLQFNTNIEKSSFANYLSNAEKNVIYVHLLWASCLLSFLTICIIVYAYLYTEKQIEGYGEKYKNFIRK